jgi:hypothetical protein
MGHKTISDELQWPTVMETAMANGMGNSNGNG